MLSGRPWRPCSQTNAAKHIVAYTRGRFWKKRDSVSKIEEECSIFLTTIATSAHSNALESSSISVAHTN
jgi:hypothetical protein